MCFKWLRHDRTKKCAVLHAACESRGDTASSSNKPSGLFTSTGLSSEFVSSASSSVSVALVKDVLPQRPLLCTESEIAAATRNFNNSQQIGSSAWKGVLRGFPVAIVRKPGQADDFTKRLKNLHALHHKSLVKVVGGCMTHHSVFVVYEFIEGVDLQSCLCSDLAPGYTVLSTWKSRVQVASDVAKGLEYAHQHVSSHSAHKHLTSGNILVTNETLRAKLALVGMSVLTGEVRAGELTNDLGQVEVDGSFDQREADGSQRKKRLDISRSIKIKGSPGYMPPEYLSLGVITQKYDVFTFGIVLLELLKGEGTRHEERSKLRKASIVDEVRPIFSDENVDKGSFRLWMDRRLRDSYPVDDALRVVRLALRCVEKNPDKRPTMKEVALHISMLLNSAEAWERNWQTVTGTRTLAGR